MHFLINKKEGQTPLEVLEQLRREKSIDSVVPMTYAGRLDPMAEGLLLLLVGDECKKKEQYLGLDKEYEIEVLLGVGSDTGDVLGRVEMKSMAGSNFYEEVIHKEVIHEKLSQLVGERIEKYPAFSSKPINGKPMFTHAKEGSLDRFAIDEIPEKLIEIYSIDFISQQKISIEELIKTAIERISKVKGDFRQNEIIESWQSLKGSNKDSNEFSIIKIHVKSSSGAYMRTLAQKLGESLGTQALAWKIKRTKIGEYNLEATS